MVSAIIVTHGNLADELIETAKTIYGQFSNCHAVSNNGKTPQGLVDEIKSIIQSDPTAHFIVFIDFYGGSCSHACLSLQQQYKDLKLVSGVNLPILLAFLYKREDAPFEKLADELVERGRSSVRIVDADNL